MHLFRLFKIPFGRSMWNVIFRLCLLPVSAGSTREGYAHRDRLTPL